MSTIETVRGYIRKLCTDAGANPDSAYSPENEAWYFEKGPITLEVFMVSNQEGSPDERTFIRCFSNILPLPIEATQRQELYQIALEVNARNMGVKIGMMAERGFLYAIGERDIHGMNYSEFVTLISDVAYWAEQLSALLRDRFGEASSTLN